MAASRVPIHILTAAVAYSIYGVPVRSRRRRWRCSFSAWDRLCPLPTDMRPRYCACSRTSSRSQVEAHLQRLKSDFVPIGTVNSSSLLVAEYCRLPSSMSSLHAAELHHRSSILVRNTYVNECQSIEHRRPPIRPYTRSQPNMDQWCTVNTALSSVNGRSSAVGTQPRWTM